MIKPFYQLVIEGIVVGQLLVWVFFFTKYLILPNLTTYIDLTGSETAAIFVAGFLFHLLSEFSGINVWYVNNYYNILKKLNRKIN